MFTHAIVRKPGHNFADGLTTASLGAPDYTKALDQHKAYCAALRKCGLQLTVLDPDLRYPDSTFVEDTAILTKNSAILTCPGADSRKGEVSIIQESLAKFYKRLHHITSPGSLDGGDICEADGHFFIGISARTNEDGARQLADYLAGEGFTYSFVDIRSVPGILHLKSGIAYIGEGNLVAIEDFVYWDEFKGYKILPVDKTESYAANCLRINNFVLVAEGFPQLRWSLETLGYQVIGLDMSEYQKMDGGLSCLSLRF